MGMTMATDAGSNTSQDGTIVQSMESIVAAIRRSVEEYQKTPRSDEDGRRLADSLQRLVSNAQYGGRAKRDTPQLPWQPPDARMRNVHQFVEEHKGSARKNPESFSRFEEGLHAHMMDVERGLVAEVMSAYDVDGEAIEIGGDAYRRVLRRESTYMTSAGSVKVLRSLYRRCGSDDTSTVCPMDLRCGIIEDWWTGRAAKQAVMMVSHMTPAQAECVFDRIGNMAPSKASLDRLPKLVSERWEERREELFRELCDEIRIPDNTASLAVSLDGVHIPMDGSERREGSGERAGDAGAEGGVAYREAGCATVTFCGVDGEALCTVRLARAPEPNKATLKEMVLNTVLAVLRRRPDLPIVKIADGAPDNWRFLGSAKMPPGEEVLDFYHAAEHLHAAISGEAGLKPAEVDARYNELRHVLRHHKYGVGKVIRALKEMIANDSSNASACRTLKFFQTNKKRMNYAIVAERGRMIGSGLVEAACKTLVAQRLKRSGMRWSMKGAQAILTPRGWLQSDCYDEAWALLAATYCADVTVLAHVIPLGKKDGENLRKNASQ